MTYYCLDFFPYPSGAGLTVGHCRNYVPTDVVSRYYRMRGYDVLHPMGWDAFGLPAENEAIRHGVHPAESTARYAANYKRQMQLIRCTYDWDREINSSDPAYYRWTQWFFLLLYRRGLAYRAAAPVNWCSGCQTVLAHEEVEEGVCWRCGSPVVERSLPQWWFRTTAYREQLAAGLDDVDWPSHITAMQRRWIAGLRDWLVSRQRYWGAPIPIIHCPTCGIVPVPEEELPVRLPPLPTGAFEPRGDGRSPLANIPEFVNTTCPQCGGSAQRETDTMAGSVCSSWYFLRFASPHEQRFAFDRDAVKYWLPADLYAGGAEHATGHLLYARFFTRVMADAGLIDFREPFPVLRSQGVVHASDGRRMSKSRPETVVTPDDVVARHGADALRAHVLFIAPFDANVTWDDSAINGVVRWMERVRRVAGVDRKKNKEGKWDEALARGLHQTIGKVSGDIEALKFNTAIAALMSFTSQMLDVQDQVGDMVWLECCSALARMLAPFTPDLAEELWQMLGEKGSVHSQPWPEWREDLAAEETVVVVVQVNGKVRARVTMPAASDDEQTAALALADETVASSLAGRHPKRVIAVAGRLVNVIV
ncbi:MAG: class I tRNA ligase family protein [Anaerolineales bacterium]|nr:class I tRNA ligase family protein [Anaerolineales bacterium]